MNQEHKDRGRGHFIYNASLPKYCPVQGDAVLSH